MAVITFAHIRNALHHSPPHTIVCGREVKTQEGHKGPYMQGSVIKNFMTWMQSSYSACKKKAALNHDSIKCFLENQI